MDLVVKTILMELVPWRGQSGADAIQEVSAEVLQELALFGPGREVLRKEPYVLKALRELAEVGSLRAQECAAAALFVSKNDEFCIEIEELCILNKELCIKNEEFCI